MNTIICCMLGAILLTTCHARITKTNRDDNDSVDDESSLMASSEESVSDISSADSSIMISSGSGEEKPVMSSGGGGGGAATEDKTSAMMADSSQERKKTNAMAQMYMGVMMFKTFLSTIFMMFTPIIQFKGLALTAISTLINVARFLMQLKQYKDMQQNTKKPIYNGGHVESWRSAEDIRTITVTPPNYQTWPKSK